MFCGKCGHQIEDDASFCPNCGEKVNAVNEENAVNLSNDVEQNSGSSTEKYNNVNQEQKTKRNWKEFLTLENIERFAPLAAFAPIAMMTFIAVLTLVLTPIYYASSAGETFSQIIIVMVAILFILIPAAATGGLIYVAVKNKDKSLVRTWIAPAITFIAAISCISIAFGWALFAFIMGLVSVILGLELLARIVISKKPMDSSFSPKEAVATYKKFYSDYKVKYPSTKALEKAGIADPENSYFDGEVGEAFLYLLLFAIIPAVTCNIATPWIICEYKKWEASHTVINGKRMKFYGTGGDLFGKWLLNSFLCFITCGIYAFFIPVMLKKWEMYNTYIDGESVIDHAGMSYFDGDSVTYACLNLLSTVLLWISCGLAFPWTMTMLRKWDTNHRVVNGRRLRYSGTGIAFLGEYLIMYILCLVTCGIYAPWGLLRLEKFYARNTDFVNQE